jgi:UPF0176 protein
MDSIMNTVNSSFVVTTFYKFVELADVEAVRAKIFKFCVQQKIKGTILLAHEGVNATITASRAAIDSFYEFIKSIPEFADIEFKESFAAIIPFKKLKVKVRKEIVTFKLKLNMKKTGTYLDAQAWDEMLQQKKTLVIDARNDYEVIFGTFKDAVDPKTRNFTDLPEWVERNLSDVDRNQPIAMFCTGGIRCEKSTAYMKQIGFKNVYHLKGGILQYLETTKNRNNMWQGKCFVFDDRIALDSDLEAI